jgi:hypothetical protein
VTEARTVDLLILTAPPRRALPGGADRIVLLEPDATAAAAVAAAHPGIEILPLGLAPRPGPAIRVTYNQPGLFAFRPALPALRRLFPGLREIARTEVTCIDPAGLMDRLGDLPPRVALDLDCPGEEAAILEALAGMGALDSFATLSVRCGAEPFFEGAEAADALAARLRAAGLCALARDRDDPDFPVLRFGRPPGLEDLRGPLGPEERAALKTVLENRIAGLVAEREAEAARARALQTQLDAARAGQTAALEEAREDLALALRMQDMLQGDLEDLRARYREAEAARARQATLLAELAPRLRQAAEELGLRPEPALSAPHDAEAIDSDPARATPALLKSGKKSRGSGKAGGGNRSKGKRRKARRS